MYDIERAYFDWLIIQYYSFDEVKEIGVYNSWLRDVFKLYSCRAPGITCLSALKERLRKNEKTDSFISSKINESKGCGGIMRVAPIGLLSKDKAESLCSQNNLRKEINSDDKETGSLEYVDMLAAEASAITHSHPLGYMSSAVFAHIIYRIVNNVSDLSLKQIIIEARDTAAKLFAGDMYLKELTDIIDLALELSENNDKDLDNIHRLGEGWVAEETLVIALYCSLRYQNDFSSGIIASVNHKGDSDSTGAVTGNILGAICGYDAIEQKWKNDLELLGVILRVADEISD